LGNGLTCNDFATPYPEIFLHRLLIYLQGARFADYHIPVNRRKKSTRDERPVFDSIRKPTAPPSRKFGGDTAEEKLRPSLRKAKHKKPAAPEE